MFLEFPDEGPSSGPPDRPEPRLTPRGERVLFAVIGFNVVLLFVAPIAGVTFFDALAAALAP